MRARDTEFVNGLRSAIAAIDNAESTGIDAPRAGAIQASATGVAAADVPPRSITPDQLKEIFDSELVERDTAAALLDNAGRADQAKLMQSANTQLARLLSSVIAGMT